MSDDRTKFETSMDLAKVRVKNTALDAFKNEKGQARFFTAIAVLHAAALEIAHEHNELIQMMRLNAKCNELILTDWLERGATIKEV